MNLRFLRTFVAIADNNGFARAAARLNLTQSAASRQIHALETELGVRLFDRVRRSVKLTSQGEDLLVRSRRLLSDAESLRERARARREVPVPSLRPDVPIWQERLYAFMTHSRFPGDGTRHDVEL